jgi:transketolase
VASGKVLNALASQIDAIIGGSADLAPSTNTYMNGLGEFADDPPGRNIRFGVREHAMGQIVNGLALHGGFIPFGATFLVFSDYMRPSIRLAAIQQTQSIFVFTHDSIGVGEDGPTHQPVEHLASLRAIPGLSVIRPADANETAAAWKLAIERCGPTALILSRQNLPIIEDVAKVAAGVPRGAYVLADAARGVPDVILISTGSEVPIVLEAKALLANEGIEARVVSMPSWDAFEDQDEAYRNSVLPRAVRARVAVEAASPLGWHKYTGDLGEVVALNRFGASAPGPRLYAEFGFTAANVAEHARRSIARARKA